MATFGFVLIYPTAVAEIWEPIGRRAFCLAVGVVGEALRIWRRQRRRFVLRHLFGW